MFPFAALSLSAGTVAAIVMAVGAALLLPAVALVVIVLMVKRLGTQPGGSGAPNLTHVPVDWGIFTGLIQAVQANDKTRVLAAISYLGARAGEAGGVEALLEQFLYSQLERKLADPSKRTPLLSQIARLAGVPERQLLDALEQKTPATQTVVPAITGLIVLCLSLFALTSSAEAAPLRSPERFYPAEVEPVIDPPTFATARVTCPPGSQCIAPQAMAITAPTPPATISYPQTGYWQRGLIGRVFGRRCH